MADQPTPGTYEHTPPAAGRSAVVEECAPSAEARSLAVDAMKAEMDRRHLRVNDMRLSALLFRSEWMDLLDAALRALAPASPTGGQASSPVVTEAEPVAWEWTGPDGKVDFQSRPTSWRTSGWTSRPLYAAPPDAPRPDIEAARREERERCAKIVVDAVLYWRSQSSHAAVALADDLELVLADIRALGDRP